MKCHITLACYFPTWLLAWHVRLTEGPHLKFTLKMSVLCFIQRQWCVIIYMKLKMCGWVCNWVHTAFTSVISGLNTRFYDSSDAVWKWKKSPGKKKTKTKNQQTQRKYPLKCSWKKPHVGEGHKPQRQILCFWKQKTGAITVEAKCWDCRPMFMYMMFLVRGSLEDPMSCKCFFSVC